MADKRKAQRKKPEYEAALEVFLAKRKELGRMPEERDFKRDQTIDVAQLVEGLGQKSFAAAVIEVLRVIRAGEGRPENIASLSREQMKKLEKMDPEEYVARLEEQKSRREQKARLRIKRAEDFQKSKSIKESNTIEKEVAEMAEKSGGRKGKRYTYNEVWRYAKEHDVAGMPGHQIRVLGGITPVTIERHLGKREFWAEQIACETAEEGQKVLKRLLQQEKAMEAKEKMSRLGVLELDDLPEMFRKGGIIDTLGRTMKAFSITWEVVIRAGDVPVNIMFSVEKNDNPH